MKTTRIAVVITVFCLLLSCVGYAKELPVTSPEDVGMSSEALARIKPAVQALVDDVKIPGASVIVARKGNIVFFETFGMMDKEAKKPMQKDTIFRIYSMTKPVTSVAVMMLYEEGRLKLDDPVSKYVPEFKGLKVYAESGKHEDQVRKMTVRDLLRHTSGLTYGFFGNTPVDKMYRAKNIFDWQSSLEDMVNKLSGIPLLNQPGTKWHYSVSTDVLGYLVQKVSGQSLDKFFEKRIFKPLDMKDTAFHVAGKKADRFAVCYGPKADGGLKVVDDSAESIYLKKPQLFSGGGGLVSTARDYMRFCQMLLNKGQLDGNRLLHSETVEMMTSNQLPDGIRRGNDVGFGFGFSVRIEDGKFPKGEYGWGGMASTHFWISPDDELIVVALSQRMPYSAQLENAAKSIIYDSIISTPVIFDTDLDSDVDDVGALATLHALANNGEAKILAVIVTSDDMHSPLCADAINTYFCRPDIPIGVNKKERLRSFSRYTKGIAEEYPRDLRSYDDAEDATSLYRKILASQPDNSVVIITVGHLTNLKNLLLSQADVHSPLDGVALVKKKVKLWSCMGGKYPSGKEPNFYRPDPGSTVVCVSRWPKQVVFSGVEIGNAIKTGGETFQKQESPNSPVRRAYELYNQFRGRSSWDQTAVLYAVRGGDKYWSIHTKGYNHVSADGSNEWRTSPDKDHGYLVKRTDPGELASIIDELMLQEPRK